VLAEKFARMVKTPANRACCRAYGISDIAARHALKIAHGEDLSERIR
jgi:hypothetical protein